MRVSSPTTSPPPSPPMTTKWRSPSSVNRRYALEIGIVSRTQSVRRNWRNVSVLIQQETRELPRRNLHCTNRGQKQDVVKMRRVGWQVKMKGVDS
mmetsp:Transcript_1232/g.2549  ORF Transcript_1232/g.2549 Transcript_1232/m.2549 type:complete len:95 (+) Transcript_1232:969-1253(+)